MKVDLDEHSGATAAADTPHKTDSKVNSPHDKTNQEPVVDPEAPDMRASHLGMRPPPPSASTVRDSRNSESPITPIKEPIHTKKNEHNGSSSEPRSGKPPRKVEIPPSPPSSSSPQGNSRSARERRRMKDRIEQLTRENYDLKDKVRRLKDTNGALADQVRTVDTDNKLLMKENTKLDEECKRLEADIKASRRVATENEQLLKKVQLLEMDMIDLEDKVEPLTDANRQLATQNVAMQKELKDREDTIQIYKATLDQRDQDWAADRAELEKLKKSAEMLKNLQQEVLAGVDRHEPTFDEKIHSRFITVNGKINSAVRSIGKGLTLFSLFASTPFDNWTRNAIPTFCYNPKSKIVSVRDKKVIKLLMRLAIWNFIEKTLFDRRRPFAVFGSTMAQRLTEDYMDMFEDYKTSETAAKWRAMTARRLAELDNKGYQDRVLNELIERFAIMVHEEIGYKEKSAGEISDLLRGEMFPKIEPVLRAAMDLAYVVFQERAGYTLVIPDLQKLQFEKIEDDEYFTNCVRLSNIDVESKDEEEIGMVTLVASPILYKWGSGSGDQLTHKTILEKAFVLVEPFPE